jgi:hypothetical protein
LVFPRPGADYVAPGKNPYATDNKTLIEPLKPRSALKTQTRIGLSWTWACLRRASSNHRPQQIKNYLGFVKRKLYKDAWEKAGQRSRSGKGEECTVVGPNSKPRLLPKKRLEEGNRVSKEERKEAEQEKFDKIPKKALQNGMVQKMAERVHEIQDAE